VERLADLGLQLRDVVVADVAAVLAQMRGDPVRPGLDRNLRCLYGIRMAPAARVADGGNVVNIDAEAEGGDGHAQQSVSDLHVHPVLDLETIDPLELPFVIRDEGEVERFRMSGNPQVVWSDRLASGFECCPNRSVDRSRTGRKRQNRYQCRNLP